MEQTAANMTRTMANHPNRPSVIRADLRVALLRKDGHTLDITGDNRAVTATITRTDSKTFAATITPANLPDLVRAGLRFNRYPQNVLNAYALHAVCDWNDRQTLYNTFRPCAFCGTKEDLFPMHETNPSRTTWWCRPCYAGDPA